jgi:hypothetical protein
MSEMSTQADYGAQADVAGLRELIGSLRQRLPPGAKIAVVGSVRSRDRATIATGEVLPLALASPLFCDPQWGHCVRHTTPRIHVFDGLLSERHTSTLIPVLEQAAQMRVDVVIAASEIDESVLALMIVNKQRNALRVSGLLGDAQGTALSGLARALGVKLGVASEQLVVEAPGTVHTLLATPYETILLIDPRMNPAAPPLGLLFVGGGDEHEIRARTAAARALLRPN